ncbi:MAG: copper amine oxidase N-terminal domain-containing protein, partial [Firmicutes bacterium]|nr:copper amine oxidase N-terminal domain-containing protein [Bacillota bacterium]
AKIVPPFKVTADKPEITVGVQNQKVGDITLTETEDGAIEEGKWVVFEAPAGMTFADTPDVKVTEGDIDIDDEDVDDEYFAFRVTGESGKKASTIKISNITFDVDRTIPVGDVNFKVYLVDEDYDNDGTVEIDNVNDIADNDEELEEVTKVTVGTVVTPAPEEKKATVVFKVSDTKFTVNGVEQTMDVAPYVKNGRTYVPVRYSAQAVGVAAENILYSGGKVTLIKGDKVVQFTIGSNVMLINGVAVTMDVKAEITNGRTMLPFRWVAQALGANVDWDPNSQAVTMTL